MSILPFDTDIALSVEDEDWLRLEQNLEQICTTTVTAIFGKLNEINTFQSGPPENRAVVELSIVFENDAAIHLLNKEHRSKDQPTNVLSFPEDPLDQQSLETAVALHEPLMLGDIVMARETLVREAQEQKKTFRDHMSHLLVHGVLHLAGYDHMEENEAALMEELEISILSELGIANPYELSD
jgi:probable rRNA maturation factor